MSANFTLTRKGEFKPKALTNIDAEICEHLGIELHPENWCVNWYNTIGFSLALGCDWAEVTEIWGDRPDWLRVIEFLRENYTVDCWYGG